MEFSLVLFCFVCCCKRKNKIKLFLWQAAEIYRVVRRRGSHIFYTIGSQMAVSLSALRPQEHSWDSFLLGAETTPGP
jgi:hypothetical protein